MASILSRPQCVKKKCTCIFVLLLSIEMTRRFNRSHYDDVTVSAMASQITSLTIVYSTVYSDPDQRKHQSSASLAFVQGIHRGPVNSPHKWPVTRKTSPFDDVIMLLKDMVSFILHSQYRVCWWLGEGRNQRINSHGNDTVFPVTFPFQHKKESQHRTAQIGPLSFQAAIPHKPRQVRWGELHAPVVTEWSPACLHKLLPGAHQRATKENLKRKTFTTYSILVLQIPFKF